MNANILNTYDLLHVSEEATLWFSVGFFSSTWLKLIA